MASQPTRPQAPGGQAESMEATRNTQGSGPVARPAGAAAGRPPVTSAAAIQVAGLRKKFGHVVAVQDVSFTVAYGRITGFLGPNGAGKTTTLRMLLGLIRPDAGTAAIAGRHPTRTWPARPGPSARCSMPPPTPAAPAGTTCGYWPQPPGSPGNGPASCWPR